MTLTVAQISPYAWPPAGDVAEGVDALAHALAARGHRVTVFAPSRDRAAVAQGKARIARAADDPDQLSSDPGSPRLIALGRPLPGTGRGRLGGPVDLSTSIEAALSRGRFDVVHLHEPLAPSPALGPLSRASAIRAVSFHRPALLAGVAFLGPLVERALARVAVRTVPDETGRRALADVLPGEYELVPPGFDCEPLTRRTKPGLRLVMVARGRDRVGARFAVSVARALDPEAFAEMVLLGPADAPWRTRAAVPKALRERVTVVPDDGRRARAMVLAGADLALVASPEDAAGPALREAMAAGCAILAPRTQALEGLVSHGRDALLLPPFSAPVWAARLGELAADPARRAALGAAARERAELRPWDAVAAQMEGLYERARARHQSSPGRRVLADLRVRAAADTDPGQIVDAAVARGLNTIAVAGPSGIGVAEAVKEAADERLRVIVGAEIATQEGTLIGLFLVRDVERDQPLAGAISAVHAQGGLAMIPHPDALPAPSAASLRQHADAIDCFEVASAAAGSERGGALALRLGVIGCATSGAARPGDVGALAIELDDFNGPADLLDALASDPTVRPAHAPRTRRARRASRRS